MESGASGGGGAEQVLRTKALGSPQPGVGAVIGFLSIASENRLLKPLKRKSLPRRSREASPGRWSTYPGRGAAGTMETRVSTAQI